MILGLGSDIIDINRISSIYKSYGASFVKRICTAEEINNISKLNQKKYIAKLAKIWAAKEALSKALGTGIGTNFSFLDACIINNSYGKPSFKISDNCKDYITKNMSSQFQIHLSISDDTNMAFAVVIIDKP